MSKNSRVVWSEGLFIRPHHFQQMQRNLEYLVEARAKTLSGNRFGIVEVKINEDHLKFGKITLEHVTGIMPDGTFFDFPAEDILPEPLEIGTAQSGNEIVYLAVMERNEGQSEVGQNVYSPTRFCEKESLVKDTHSIMGNADEINLSPVKLSLMLGSEDMSSYSTIAIAKIKNRDNSGELYLYNDYIPCHLNSRKIKVLDAFLAELEGLVRTRSQNIALRVGSPTQGGVADVSDFMMLQVLNLMHGELQGLINQNHLHPETLYKFMMRYCSEISTFVAEDRLSPKFMAYDHVHPDTPFKELMRLLRQVLSIEFDLRAIPIKINRRDHGLSIAPLSDPSLISSAEFVLALKAQMPTEDLKRYFVQQAKIASIEKIRDITSVQLPAIPLLPLPVTPRQLPYHADFIYFKLDKNHPSWKMLEGSSGFAFHVPFENFPELQMQFWAIPRH